jgi:[acyl-carrier-protein] S-malonyltransferase
MAALLGADRQTAEEICQSRRRGGGRLQLANVNAPGQMVVAGGAADITWLTDNAGDLGVRRVIPLNVAGAFHSELMASAQVEVGDALESVRFGAPRFPVWSNTTARPHDPVALCETMARQVVEPVLFVDSLLDMADHGIDTFIHVGPGDVTAGLARRTVEGAAIHSVSDLEDIPAVAGVVGTMGRP